MPSVNGFIALLTGATLHTLIVLSCSHDLPPKLVISAPSSIASSPRRFQTVPSNFTSTRRARVAWVANLHGSSYGGQAALHDDSRAIAAPREDVPPRHHAYRSLAHIRGRPKSRRRRSGGAFCVAGIEGVGLPPRTSTQTTTTNSAVSVPQPGNTTLAAGGITKQKLPAGGDRKGQAVAGSRSLKTPMPGAGASSNASIMLANSGPTMREGQQQADTDADVLEDEGEVICRLLEGNVCRDVEVAGEIFRFRVARLDEYLAIADVRFNVFSPVHTTLKHRFRERSRTLMGERRRRGAFCLVAVLERLAGAAAGSTADGRGGDDDAKQGSAANGSSGHSSSCRRNSGGSIGEEGPKDDDRMREVLEQQHVLGTLECSKHEFDNTPLAEQGSVQEGIVRYVFARVCQ